MALTQLNISDELDKKILNIQARKGISTKQETILFILDKALAELKIEEVKPEEIQKVSPN